MRDEKIRNLYQNPLLEDDDDEDDEDNGKDEPTENGGKDPRGDDLTKMMLDTRSVLIAAPVSDKLYQKVASQLMLLEARDSEAPVIVYVNSPGGSADSGFAIYDLMRFVKPPIITVCNGICASAAVIIFLGGDKGMRFTLPNSRYLIHQPSTFGQGTAADLDITAKEIIKIRQRYNEIVSEATGKSVEQITKDADRDFWLSAQEAIDYGLTNKIISSKTELPLGHTPKK